MDLSDSEENFQFKPLTEGLGFHKKADKIKSEIKSTNLGRETASRVIPEPPPKSLMFDKFEDDEKAPASKSTSTSTAMPKASRSFDADIDAPTMKASRSFDSISDAPAASESNYRTASQSISELMASLPPSLDFLDEKPDLARTATPITPISSRTPPKLAGPAAASQSMTTSIAPAPENRPQIFQPLARPDYKEEIKPATSSAGPTSGPTIGSVLPPPGTKAGTTMSTAPAAAAIPAPLVTQKVSPYREKMNEAFTKAFPHTEKTKATETEEDLIATNVSLPATFIDALMVAGLSTILLVCILTITKINLIGMLSNAATDGPTQLNLFLLFLAVLQMYMLISRAFFGATLGEWAFDQQLGTDADQRNIWYPVQVLGRTLVNTATGLVVLPLLSFAFKRDLAKYITGLQIYRRP